jgi:hypothetical protein
MLQVVSENNAYLQDLNTRSRSIKVHGNELSLSGSGDGAFAQTSEAGRTLLP